MMLRNRVLELFEYDPDTGVFVWRIDRGPKKAGTRAGGDSGHGYRVLGIDYKVYLEHRLAWLIVHGEMPEELDHIDGNPSNNAISNLRLATRSQNTANSGGWAAGLSGLRGVYKDWRRPHRWFAQIQVDRRTIFLGWHKTPDKAHAAYLKAAEKYFGEYAYHRRGVQPSTMETC